MYFQLLQGLRIICAAKEYIVQKKVMCNVDSNVAQLFHLAIEDW
jgi:hypothetical protein